MGQANPATARRFSLRRFLRLLARLTAVVIITLPFLAVAMWLSFQHKPGWYRPVDLTDGVADEARRSAVTVADFVGDGIVGGTPFDVVLPAATVNAWLAALPETWPDAWDQVPDGLHAPALSFDGDAVRVGAHYTDGRWQAIVNLSLRVRVSKNRERIQIQLLDVRAGSLPLPRSTQDRVVNAMLQAMARQRETAGDDGALAPLLADVKSAQDLFDGITIKNDFVWFNGQRPFRLLSIRCTQDELRLRIDPL